MGAIIRDPKDNRRLARVQGSLADGDRLGDGLVTHAINWVTEPVSGILRRLRGDHSGRLYLSMTHGTDAYSFETVTVAATAIGITSSVHSPSTGKAAVRAFLSLESGQVRYRYDGTDPTSAVGHLLQAGDAIELEGDTNIRNFRAIRTGAVSGSLSVTVER